MILLNEAASRGCFCEADILLTGGHYGGSMSPLREKFQRDMTDPGLIQENEVRVRIGILVVRMGGSAGLEPGPSRRGWVGNPKVQRDFGRRARTMKKLSTPAPLMSTVQRFNDFTGRPRIC